MTNQDNPDYTPKMNPDDPRLSLERQRTRTIKKGPIIAVLIAVGLILTLTIYSALQPRTKQEKGIKHTSIDTDMVMRSIPDTLRGAAGNYGQLDYPEVPKLGEPLPGDLGGFVKPQPQTTIIPQPAAAPQVKQPSPEELERLRQERLAREAREKALAANVFFSSGASATGANGAVAPAYSSGQNSFAGTSPSLTAASNTPAARDPNMQSTKQQFLANAGKGGAAYLNASLQAAKSPYEVKAGTIIPAVLITGINSDLPGMITAQVRERVFDSSTGQYLLIPQGTRMIGTYNSNVSYGQNRALVVWSRLIFPNGSSINLDGMPGVDLAGQAGYADKVDHHWGRLVSGVILSSLLAGTAQNQSDGDGFRSRFTNNVGGEINRVGRQFTRKNLDIQPTIKIRPGYSINVMVNKDIILKPYPQNI